MKAITLAHHRRGGSTLKGRVTAVYAALIAVNLIVWAWAYAVLSDVPALLGTALLAYTFGLRHALDADHIAAIDNVTRKLVGEGHQPIGVGLYFALGHSAVVFVGVLLISMTTKALHVHFDRYREIGAIIGSYVSTSFLLLIAIVNAISLWQSLYRVAPSNPDSAEPTAVRTRVNFMAGLCQPLFGLIRRSWLMMPLGFLFGLGFETATEIAILSAAAHQAAAGIPIWTIMVFPALFAAGMLAIDATDGILMLAAYQNANISSDRAQRHGVWITAISTLMALVIGATQALSLAGHQLRLDGALWDMVDTLEHNIPLVGYLFIAALGMTWLVFAASSRRDHATRRCR